MMSAKVLYFWPPPPRPHLDLMHSIKFMQPPFLRLLFHDSLPPLMLTSYLGAPQERRRLG